MCIVQSYIYKTNVSGMVKSESTVYLLIYIHISYMCKNNTEKHLKLSQQMLELTLSLIIFDYEIQTILNLRNVKIKLLVFDRPSYPSVPPSYLIIYFTSCSLSVCPPLLSVRPTTLPHYICYFLFSVRLSVPLIRPSHHPTSLYIFLLVLCPSVRPSTSLYISFYVSSVS